MLHGELAAFLRCAATPALRATAAPTTDNVSKLRRGLCGDISICRISLATPYVGASGPAIERATSANVGADCYVLRQWRGRRVLHGELAAFLRCAATPALRATAAPTTNNVSKLRRGLCGDISERLAYARRVPSDVRLSCLASVMTFPVPRFLGRGGSGVTSASRLPAICCRPHVKRLAPAADPRDCSCLVFMSTPGDHLRSAAESPNSLLSNDNSLIAPIRSLFCCQNSLFARKQFPVPLHREFCGNTRNLRSNSRRLSGQG